jgi:HEAT repeat protein
MATKDRVKNIILERDRQALVDMALDDRRTVTALNRLIFHQDPLVRWRAVEALGWIAAEDPFILEPVISRLFYTMNDDSGSIGWFAPQALGEICANDPDLVADYFGIIVTSLKLEVFRAGAAWAVGRVAAVRPDLTAGAGSAVLACLDDPDAQVRGFAAWALGRLRFAPAAPALDRRRSDPGELRFYEDGELTVRTVGQLAAAALEKTGA